MVRLFGTLIVGILSAALAIIFQNDIAAFVGRAPVTADVTVGAWYPSFDAAPGRRPFREVDEDAIRRFSAEEDTNFARIVIKNRSGKTIPQSYLVLDSDWGELDAVLLGEEGGKNRQVVHSIDRRIEVGELPAASTKIVYLWSTRTFGYPFYMEGLQLITSDGRVPTSVSRFTGGTGSFVFGIRSSTIAWVLVFLLIVISIILIAVVSHYHEVAKKFLGDDDFYLNERVKFEGNPDKYTVPNELPKT